jgi:hypothetical protein
MKKIKIIQIFDSCHLTPRIKSQIVCAAGDRRELSALDILAMDDISAGDRIYTVLRPELIAERILHLFACEVAEGALKLVKDPRPASVSALEAKRKWLAGEITDKELAAAWDAAWDAAAWSALDAAWAAAKAAEDAVARVVAWSAADAVARVDARAAVRDAADARAARDAAAAWSARDAAWAALSAIWYIQDMTSVEYSVAQSASWAAAEDAKSSAEFASQWAVISGSKYIEEEWQIDILTKLLQ